MRRNSGMIFAMSFEPRPRHHFLLVENDADEAAILCVEGAQLSLSSAFF